MRARLLVAGLSLVATPALYAQSNSCASGTTQDACQMAIDVFQFMAPQLGVALTGGNATLGRGGTLGGLPHFTIGLRGNVLSGDVPNVDQFPVPSITGRQQRELQTDKQIIGLPTVDAAVGIFKGLPLGLTNVGGIDLLVSATYIPEVGGENDDFQVKPDHNLQLGYGARLGIIQESLLLPGVSVTYIKRDLPTTSIAGRSAQVDIDVRDMKVKTTAWRVVASKSLVMFGIAVGAGQDRYDQSAMIQATTAAQTSSVVDFTQDLTRTNVFADLSLNLPLLKLVGEVGQVSGGKVETYNTFSGGAADKSRVYGSLGLRFQF
jgi:hypothetical protein